MAHAAEYADFRREDVRVARQAHACCACGETIPKGATYSRWATSSEGVFASYVQCVRCRAVFEAICVRSPRAPVLFDLGCGESWESVFGACPEDVQELAFILPTDTVDG